MDRQIDIVAEVRKHPGIVLGALAVVTGVAVAAVLLTQRTGPRRYEVLRGRMDPRSWIDAEALRHRFEDISRGLTDRASALGDRAGALGDRAGELGDDAQQQARKLFERGRKAVSADRRKTYARSARRYADDAGRYAKDHAREGGALLAVATIAAAVGAAALESRRPDSRVRRIAKF